MSEHHFETHRPVSLLVEIGKGSVTIVATDTTESSVEVTGRDAESVRVEQSGDQISVVAPKQRTGFLAGDSRLDVSVTVPTDSDLAVRTGSADITVDGVVDTGQIRSGSGEVQVDTFGGPAVVETGSGERPDRRGTLGAAYQERLGRHQPRPHGLVRRRVHRIRRRRDRHQRRPDRRQDRLGRPRRSSTHSPTSRSPPAAATSSSARPCAGESPPRAPRATSGWASRPACRSGPTSRPCPARSAAASTAPAGPRRAPTTSRSAPRPSAATSS